MSFSVNPSRKACREAVRTVVAGKFLTLEEIDYRDETAHLRHWDCVSRNRHCNAVMIIAQLLPQKEVILVSQYRPPADAYMLEFPAGLLEDGESPEEGAVRELYEETGYRGVVTDVLPVAYSSSGLSSEGVATVYIDIDGAQYPTPPLAHPDEGEHIEVIRVAEAELFDYLQRRRSEGMALDAKLQCYAHCVKRLGGKL